MGSENQFYFGIDQVRKYQVSLGTFWYVNTKFLLVPFGT